MGQRLLRVNRARSPGDCDGQFHSVELIQRTILRFVTDNRKQRTSPTILEFDAKILN
jgi:hypothetical protein